MGGGRWSGSGSPPILFGLGPLTGSMASGSGGPNGSKRAPGGTAPLNRKNIKEKLDENPDDRAVQRDLSVLKNLGLVVQEGKARSIIWSLYHSKY